MEVLVMTVDNEFLYVYHYGH